MDVDKAFANLGNPGAYNVVLYIIFFTSNAFVSFNHVALSSMYGVSIPHKCYDAQTKNVSDSQEIFNATSRRFLQCSSEDIFSNDSMIETRKCNKWSFTYPHGITNTWVNEFDLVCDKKYVASMSTSLYMAGVMLGSILIGMASDRYGRRPMLLLCLGISFVLCFIMAFIPNLIALLVIRCILGIFIAGVHGIVYIIPTEMSAKKHKNMVSVSLLNSFIFGALVGCLVCWLVKDWRMTQVVLSIPGGICFILSYLLVPESPRWSLTHNKFDKHANFFRNALKFNRIKGKRRDEIEDYLTEHQELSKTSTTKRKHYTVFDVFRTPKLRKRSLIGIYLWFTAGISFYTLVLNMRTLNDNPFLAILIGASTDLPSFLLGFLYVPTLGKRRSLLLLMLSGGTCCLTYAMYNSIVILLIGKSFVSASFGVVFIYLPEVYPTVVRNIGVGTLSLFSRFGSTLAPQVVLLGFYTSKSVPVIIVGCLSLLAGILSFFAPETKGKELPNTIEEIERKDCKEIKDVTNEPLSLNDEQTTSLM